MRKTSTGTNQNFLTFSPAARKRQVRFVESQQPPMVVMEGYGHLQIAAPEDYPQVMEAEEDVDLLDGVDLTSLDDETVTTLYEDLQIPHDQAEDLDFDPVQ